MRRNRFWNGSTYQVVKDLKARGNKESWINQWARELITWAESHSGPDANAIRAWAPTWKPQPFMPADELSPIFPVLAFHLGHADRVHPRKSPSRLRHELVRAGLPILQNTDGTNWFHYAGEPREMFIIEQIHEWKGKTLTQEEFENVLYNR